MVDPPTLTFGDLRSAISLRQLFFSQLVDLWVVEADYGRTSAGG
jgi:hypothetical protein